MAKRSNEHGLLMSGPMALAAYRGIKTQTRRPVKFPRKRNWNGAYWSEHGDCDDGRPGWIFQDVSSSLSEPDECFDSVRLDCPFGRVGDRIYVRETYQTIGCGHRFGVEISYAADGLDPIANRIANENVELNDCPDHDDKWRPLNWGKWRPSIHMPKWAARTWCTITDVRVERVQSISTVDAIAEGIERHDCDGVTYYGEFENGHCDPRVEFQRLWGSLYSGESNWFANPWAWVVCWERDK